MRLETREFFFQSNLMCTFFPVRTKAVLLRNGYIGLYTVVIVQMDLISQLMVFVEATGIFYVCCLANQRFDC